MSQNIIVRHPRELTLAWAQRVLDQQAVRAKARRIEIVSVDIGTTTRVCVAVDHDGPDHLPKLWFVKLPSLNWRARLITSLPRLLAREIRFYNEIASIVPIQLPPILAAQSRFGQGSTLVLANISEFAAVPGRSCDTLTAAQAALVIKRLAYFHAHFWGRVHLDPAYSWLTDSVRHTEQRLGSALAVPLMKRGIHLAGQLIARPIHRLAIRYAGHRNQMMRFLAQGPHTLVHHDCHPGNLFWSQTQPGLLDWQLVRTGEGIGDVAYFLATAIDPETRRLHEHGLLESYFQILLQQGVVGLDFKTLLQRYRVHLAYPFEAMVVTLAIGGMMDLPSNLELIRRSAAAVGDFDTFNAIADAVLEG